MQRTLFEEVTLPASQKRWLARQSAAEQEDFAERAAIIEFDGGKDRDAAELLALNLMQRRLLPRRKTTT
jgi:hypothetical protein